MGKKTNREFKCVTLFTIRQVSTLYFQLFLVQWMSSRNLQRFAKVPSHILLLILFPYLVDHVNRWLLILSHILFYVPSYPWTKNVSAKATRYILKCWNGYTTRKPYLKLTHFWPTFPFYTPWKHQKNPKRV